MKSKYYGYRLVVTGESGVVSSWGACEKLVKGKAARFRGFATKAEAQQWVSDGAQYQVKKPAHLERGIYFDAGTGRGKGVEVKVTDEKGESLLHLAVPAGKLTEFATYRIARKSTTNNYGELLGCFYALTIALTKNIRKVFGDSRLVVMYWSKGFIKKEVKSKATHELAANVKLLRQEFEAAGGSVGLVSGDDNPADLGFHK